MCISDQDRPKCRSQVRKSFAQSRGNASPADRHDANSTPRAADRGWIHMPANNAGLRKDCRVMLPQAGEHDSVDALAHQDGRCADTQEKSARCRAVGEK